MSMIRNVAVAAVLLSACTANAASPIAAEIGARPRLDEAVVAVDPAALPETEASEDWCTTLEGRAGAWLAADEYELVVDQTSGDTFTLDAESRDLLTSVASEGIGSVSPEQFAQLDTLLRLPVPSPLACQTAYDARDR